MFACILKFRLSLFQTDGYLLHYIETLFHILEWLSAWEETWNF